MSKTGGCLSTVRLSEQDVFEYRAIILTFDNRFFTSLS